MKKQTLFLIAMSICCIMCFDTMATKSYKKANPSAQIVDLPKATKELNKALKKGNDKKALEAYDNVVYSMLEISSDSIGSAINVGENMLTNMRSDVAKNIAHYKVGALYHQYYSANSWRINRRKEVADDTTSNIFEWSAKPFDKKIMYHFRAALTNPSRLKKESAKNWNKTLIIETQSPESQPSILEVLAYNILEKCNSRMQSNYKAFTTQDFKKLMVPAAEFIKLDLGDTTESLQYYGLKILQILLNENITNSSGAPFIEAEFSRLTYVNSFLAYTEENQKLFLTKLEELSELYKRNPNAITIQHALASTYYQRGLWREGVSNIDGELKQNKYYLQKALNLCDQVIAMFPKDRRINIIKELKADIKTPDTDVECYNLYHPNDSITITVSGRNIQKLELKVYKVMCNELPDGKKSIPDKFISTKTCNFPDSTSIFDNTFKITLPPLAAGKYIIYATTNDLSKDTISNNFYVSRVCSTTRTICDNDSLRQRILIVDLMSGQPIPNISVLINYGTDTDNPVTQKSNSLGIIDVTKAGADSYTIVGEGGDPDLSPVRYLSPLNYTFRKEADNDNDNDKVTENVDLRTDRTIYRPGQTVKFAGVVTQSSKSDKGSIVDKKNFKVCLKTNNSNSVDSLQVTTDQFGSFHGEFTLAKDAVSGNYFLSVDNRYYTNIEVSEYKRSTFEVTLVAPKDYYTFGTPIVVKGNATNFSGESFSNAKVSYSLNDSPLDSLTTDKNGNFSITTELKEVSGSYNTLEVWVLNRNGETQTASIALHALKNPLLLSTSCPTIANSKDPISIKINTQYNTYDNFVKAKGTVKIYLKDDTTKTPLMTKSVESNTDSLTLDLQKFASGEYIMEIEMATADNFSNKDFNNLTLWSMDDTKLPVKKLIWSPTHDIFFNDGEKTNIYIGSCADNANVLLEIFADGQLIKTERFTLNNEVKILNYDFNKLCTENAQLEFTVVKNGEMSTQTIRITKRDKKNTIRINTVVFRDKSTPGADEKWSFSISDANGKAVNQARVFATMYDASLDKIRYYKWNTLQTPYWNNRPTYFSWNSNIRSLNGMHGKFYLRGYVGSAKGANNISMSSDMVGESGVSYGAMSEDAIDNSTQQKFRTNFNETALFIPDLQTDKDGVVHINFTIPESNTEWKLMLMAYTKDLSSAILEKSIVSSKPIMVRPNIPRYLRLGDKADIAFTVSNLTDSMVKGSCNFELYNTTSGKTLFSKRQNMTLDASGGQVFNVSFDAPTNLNEIGVRVSAISANFSDGEQHVIPVLASRTLVTETISLNTSKKGETKYSVPSLNNKSETRSDVALTLELTSNPIWSVVGALPSMVDDNTFCVTGIAASLYTKCVAQYLIKEYPELKSYIEVISKANMSPLGSNDKLRNVSLKNTIWGGKDKQDSIKIASLITLFDNCASQKAINKSIDKLQESQNHDGGWGWIKGFRSDEFITLNTVSTLLRAVELDSEITESRYPSMFKSISKAKVFLKERLEKNPKMSYNKLLYLYVFKNDVNMPDSVKKAVINDIKGNWRNKPLYEQALSASILELNNNHKEALEIIKYFRERSTSTDSQGMWWQNNVNNNYIYSNTSTMCQLAMIEAFKAVDPRQDELLKMTNWLISQKQVQDWGSVPSTVDAVNAIISLKHDSPKENTTKVKWLGKTTKLDSKTLQTSYMNVVAKDSELQKKGAEGVEVTITKADNNLIWGAVYHQYYEDFDKIVASGTGVKIAKKFLVERDGKFVSTDKTELKVGDKVTVRLTISSDRDIDYVTLSDAKGACMESTSQVSEVKYQDGVAYMAEYRDNSTNFYLNYLPKGTFVLDYQVWIDRKGTYNVGNATLQSMFAPQFTATTQGGKIVVK